MTNEEFAEIMKQPQYDDCPNCHKFHCVCGYTIIDITLIVSDDDRKLLVKKEAGH